MGYSKKQFVSLVHCSANPKNQFLKIEPDEKVSKVINEVALCMCVPSGGTELAKISVRQYDVIFGRLPKLYFTVNNQEDELTLQQEFPNSKVFCLKRVNHASRFANSYFHSRLVNTLWREVQEDVCIFSDYDCILVSNKIKQAIEAVQKGQCTAYGTPYTKQKVYIKSSIFEGKVYKRQNTPNLIYSIINKKQVSLSRICDLEDRLFSNDECDITYESNGKRFVRDTGDYFYSHLVDNSLNYQIFDRRAKKYQMLKTSIREYFFETIESPEEYLMGTEVILVHLKKFVKKQVYISPQEYFGEIGLNFEV